MNEKKSPLLVSNYIALGISIIVLAAILITLLKVFLFNEGLFFGMMLAFTFPALLIFASAGAVLYLVLFVFNIRAATQTKMGAFAPQQKRRIWIVFSGTTISVFLITIICGVVSTPLIISSAREFSVRNPFVTSIVRNVPTYPAEIWDDQSEYNEMGETFFRSYNVPNIHPDEIATWHKKRFSEPPWSISQVNHYIKEDQHIGRIIYYCIQVKMDEGRDQQQIYFIEIFGEASKSYRGTHVNIGTPKPITNVCEQFINEQ